nr:hypothetical protein [Fredinandcohnia onubensis]
MSKEKSFYKKYCSQLIIVYLDGSLKNDKDITYVSAEELKEIITVEKIKSKINAIQNKMCIDYIINNFDERLSFYRNH